MSQTKLALVTGAGVRLGQASAIRLAQEGYDLLIHYHSSRQPAEETERAVRDAGRRAWLLQGDLSRAEGVRALADQVIQLELGLDLLVNNAAIFYPTPEPEDWLAHWDEVHFMNLKSPFLLTTHLLPLLTARRGCVINIVDIWARYPLKRFLPYSVAKAGLEALTRAMALELAPEVRVNGVSPGAALPATGGDTPLDRMLSQVPLGRLGGAESIADAVAFLAQADYITGQILAVDGGRTVNL